MNSGEAEQIATLIIDRVRLCGLAMEGSVLATEAATNAYASTSAGAVLAGADVWAYAQDSRFGSAESAVDDVLQLVELTGGDERRIQFTGSREEVAWSETDIVTNSGFMRPIASSDIARMKAGSVIALMYEAWEARSGDIDFQAAERAGVEVVGVNERHPMCGAFEFVGDLALVALKRRGWLKSEQRILILSDNKFADPLLRSLRSVSEVVDLVAPGGDPQRADVVVVAVTPPLVPGGLGPEVVTESVLSTGASRAVQLWGDLDRSALVKAGVSLEPLQSPVPGHQGIGMSEAGHEAVVRLQVAGIAAAVHREAEYGSPHFGLAQRGVGQRAASGVS